MLKEAIETIASMAANQTYVIGGENYSDKPLERIPKHIDKPCDFKLSGLDGVAKLIHTEIARLDAPLFVRVTTPTQVDVFTTYLADMDRNKVYVACAEVPGFHDGYEGHMETIIRLRSRFAVNEGQEYLLKLLSSMNMEQSAQSTDNGVTQTVTAKQGISLAQTVAVKPIVKLKPYRTFLEVDQPESEFLLRIDDSGRVGLFEADGGAWKLAAKKNVVAYFEECLKDMIETGLVVVTM